MTEATHPIEKAGPGWTTRMLAQQRMRERAARQRAMRLSGHVPLRGLDVEGFDA